MEINNLVNALEQKKVRGKAGRIANGLLRMDLAILDELGLPSVQLGRRRVAAPSALKAVWAHQRGDHHKLELRRMRAPMNLISQTNLGLSAHRQRAPWSVLCEA
jgi:hypothetical protein